eukprot:19859-Rhodomonas_salina.2
MHTAPDAGITHCTCTGTGHSGAELESRNQIYGNASLVQRSLQSAVSWLGVRSLPGGKREVACLVAALPVSVLGMAYQVVGKDSINYVSTRHGIADTVGCAVPLRTPRSVLDMA